MSSKDASMGARPVKQPSFSRQYVMQDWQTNDPAAKPRFLLAYFRFAQSAPRPVRKLVRLSYRLVSDWILGIELHWETLVGSDLRLDHGHGLVVHPATVIGYGCTLRHGVTIGKRSQFSSTAPVIGNHVDFGAHSIVLGEITVGSGAVIGAGAVVIRDVPENAVVVGNPARVVRTLPEFSEREHR